MIDTHTHLYMPEYPGSEGEEAVARAVAAGVSHMIFPGVSLESWPAMRDLAAKFPANVSMAMGLHPTEVREGWQEEVARMEGLMDAHRFVAVGEVGIDLYWDKTFREAQMQAFERQAAAASKRGLPLIIHCREGLDETLEVLQGFSSSEIPSVTFHSFTAGPEAVEKIRKGLGDVYFGVNGVVTFKNARELREALPEIGAGRIVLETDSPYLAPVPCRGRRNESSLLPHIRDCVAATLSLPPSTLETLTDRTAATLFSLPVAP